MKEACCMNGWGGGGEVAALSYIVHAVHTRGLYVLCDHTNCLKCSHALTELILCIDIHVHVCSAVCLYVRTYGTCHSKVFIELPYECHFHSYGILVPVLVEHLYQ